MDSIVVVGLGNPGTEYDGTRHNLGFMVVDELTQRTNSLLKAGQGEYLVAVHRLLEKTFIFAKPLTYMNNSGQAVAELLKRYDASVDRLMVIADDLALPLGTIRVRAKGNDGGHNGLLSIIYQLNSNEFPRIRCGIQQNVMPPKENMAEFVLSAFERSEQKAAKVMIRRAADAVMMFAENGMARTMNSFNTLSQV